MKCTECAKQMIFLFEYGANMEVWRCNNCNKFLGRQFIEKIFPLDGGDVSAIRQVENFLRGTVFKHGRESQ